MHTKRTPVALQLTQPAHASEQPDVLLRPLDKIIRGGLVAGPLNVLVDGHMGRSAMSTAPHVASNIAHQDAQQPR